MSTAVSHTSPRHIDTAETAKMIRAALKKAFPSVKFSVRLSRYSGGSSIRVDWFDGPTKGMVDALVGQYRGGGFDGMIDMAYSIDHWLLPDGCVMAARSTGTEGSRGTVEAFDTDRPDGAELVHFGNSHLFTGRKLSQEFMQQAFERLQRKFGPEFLSGCHVKASSYDGAAYIHGLPDFHAEQYVRRELDRLMIVRAA